LFRFNKIFFYDFRKKKKKDHDAQREKDRERRHERKKDRDNLSEVNGRVLTHDSSDLDHIFHDENHAATEPDDLDELMRQKVK
jgi:hypothetical protein